MLFYLQADTYYFILFQVIVLLYRFKELWN